LSLRSVESRRGEARICKKELVESKVSDNQFGLPTGILMSNSGRALKSHNKTTNITKMFDDLRYVKGS
jgi:hypothetical protein